MQKKPKPHRNADGSLTVNQLAKLKPGHKLWIINKEKYKPDVIISCHFEQFHKNLGIIAVFDSYRRMIINHRYVWFTNYWLAWAYHQRMKEAA